MARRRLTIVVYAFSRRFRLEFYPWNLFKMAVLIISMGCLWLVALAEAALLVSTSRTKADRFFASGCYFTLITIVVAVKLLLFGSARPYYRVTHPTLLAPLRLPTLGRRWKLSAHAAAAA